MYASGEDDFKHTSSRFMAWLQKRRISLNPKILLADLRSQNAGRGVVATDNIEEGEELFVLPLTDVLSVETSELGKLLPRELRELDEWLSLVLVLIYEYGQGEKSSWYPYLDILPTNFDTLAFWTPQELAELLGSAVLSKIGTKEANELFRNQILPIVQAHSEKFGTYAPAFAGSDAEDVLLGLAHRMATLIMAYAFDLESEQFDTESEDGSQAFVLPKGMVPLADMLNADGDRNNAHLVQQTESMHMVALKPIKKGEEILNDYGQLPRSDLLRRYGYITDRYKKWDVVEIDSEMIIRAACEQNSWDESSKEKRLELVKMLEVDDNAFDISRVVAGRISALDSALLTFIEVFSISPPTLEEKIASYEIPQEPRLTLEGAYLLRYVLTERRRVYKSTIADDVAILQNESLQKRSRMAIEVRLGEKEIITQTLDTLNQKIESMEQCKTTINGSQVPLQDAHNKERNSIKKRKI